MEQCVRQPRVSDLITQRGWRRGLKDEGAYVGRITGTPPGRDLPYGESAGTNVVIS